MSVASVDPQWLESWQLAVASRPAVLTDNNRIANKNEAGEPLIIKGQVFQPDGTTPAAEVLVHAYHRDSAGFDFGKNDKSTKTWHLQGWVNTNQQGGFYFTTIRPAPDHIGREGAHIHFTTVSKQWGKQWAPKVFLNNPSSILNVTITLKSKTDF